MRLPSLHPVTQPMRVPAYFVGKITVNSDAPLSDDDLNNLAIALSAVAVIVAKSPPPLPVRGLNIIFIASDRLEICFDDPEILGSYFQGIMYPIGLWRKVGYSRESIVFAMIEELCHAIWQLPDGPEIRDKVTEVLQVLNPGAKYINFLAAAVLQQMVYKGQFPPPAPSSDDQG